MHGILRAAIASRLRLHHAVLHTPATKRLAPIRFLTEHSTPASQSISEQNKERARRYLEQHGSAADAQAFIDASDESQQTSLHAEKPSARERALARIKKHLPVVTGDVPRTETIAKLLQLEHGAFDVTIVDVRDKAPFTNEIVVCSALTPNHVLAIADGLKDDLRRCDIRINGDIVGICGRDSRDWMAIDVGATVVHIMTEETRQRYDLEGLWMPDVAPPPTVIEEGDGLGR